MALLNTRVLKHQDVTGLGSKFGLKRQVNLYCSGLGVNLGGPQSLDILPNITKVSVRMFLDEIYIQTGELGVNQIIQHSMFCFTQSIESLKISTF